MIAYYQMAIRISLRQFDRIYLWRSEWLFINANTAIFQLYRGENNLFSRRWWWGLFCTNPTRL